MFRRCLQFGKFDVASKADVCRQFESANLKESRLIEELIEARSDREPSARLYSIDEFTLAAFSGSGDRLCSSCSLLKMLNCQKDGLGWPSI